jgi:hypothetical protein
MPCPRDTLTSVGCIFFGVFAISASGLVGNPDLPLLALVGLATLAVLWAVAAKRWHVAGVTLTRASREVGRSDARDLIRMDSDKG